MTYETKMKDKTKTDLQFVAETMKGFGNIMSTLNEITSAIDSRMADEPPKEDTSAAQNYGKALEYMRNRVRSMEKSYDDITRLMMTLDAEIEDQHNELKYLITALDELSGKVD